MGNNGPTPSLPVALAAFACACLLASLASGCSMYHQSHRTPRVQDRHYELHTVEVDDFGTFWDVERPQAVLDSIRESTSQTNTFVVVFIHGWHHDARQEDANYADFRNALAAIGSHLSGGQLNQARSDATGNASFKLIGVYVGWRGRSLPGPLDYLTMWWRKSAAERIGDGDVAEFLRRLQHLQLEADRPTGLSEGTAPANNVSNDRFIGIVTVGHSFGGQVLFRSVARPLEAELISRTRRMLEPARAPAAGHREPVRCAIDGFGDLNILVNPALEAYQFARIDSLYRQLDYPSSQTPLLVVISSDNDTARQTYFPIARAITRPFRPEFRSAHQKTLFGSALGEHAAQRTHELRLLPDGAGSQPPADAHAIDSVEQLLRMDFSDRITYDRVELAPLAEADRVRNSPVIVAYTRERIVNGHSGIFKPGFREFLTQYIAEIEGKKLALRAYGAPDDACLRSRSQQTPDTTPPRHDPRGKGATQ